MKIKILIVDDEKIIRNVLERILKKSNFHIELADNGNSALKKISKTHFDIIILDILMPEMNGIQFMKELKKINSQSKVIVISACHDNSLIKDIQNLGAIGYLKKPFNDIDQVLNAINEVAYSR